MSLNDFIQYAIVAVIVVLAIARIVYTSKHRRNNSCGCGCSDCHLSDKCDKNNADEN